MTTLSAMSAPGTVVRFLTELRATGSPVVRLRGSAAEGGTEALSFIEAEADSASEVAQILAGWHREAAEDLGGPSLAFDEASARLGARLLFRAAWCYLQRGLSREEVARLLSAQPPFLRKEVPALSIPSIRSTAPPTPPPLLKDTRSYTEVVDANAAGAALFSTDLCLRHLPAIFRMAQTLSPGDPLLRALQALAAPFPLSGIGIATGTNDFAAPDTLAVIFGHPGLRQLFLDRILAARSRDWLHHPQVAEALHQTLGSHAHALASGFLPTPLLTTQPFSLPPSDPPPAE